MKRRDFIEGVTLAGAAAAMPSLAAGVKRRKRPNLLFVFSDQHSYDLLGCNGHDQVLSPNFDAFSQESLNLNSCFSVSPLCTPMRGSLLSGQHPLHNGAYDNCVRMLSSRDAGTPYFAETLKQHGYRTGYIGKWHLYGGYWYQPVPAGPYRYGFDDLFLTNNCDLNYHPENAYYYDQHTGERILFNEWEPDGQTRQALEFLDQAGDEEPWALFISWHPPHNHMTRSADHYYAYSAPDKYLNLYEYEQVRLREGTTLSEQNRHMMHGYMALISSIDDCFGKLLQKLNERGLDENTIVVYTSDHGDILKVEQGGLFVKSRAESASSLVPFIMRAPGMTRPASRSDLPFGTLDIMPTLLSMMDIRPPAGCHGRDLSQALLRGDDTAQESVPMLVSSIDVWRGAATRDWIYSFAPHEADGAGIRTNRVLFDRRSDPHCRVNRFDHPAYKEAQERMHEITLAWMAHFEDPCMPYAALRDATIDPADLGRQGYIDFFNLETKLVS